MIPVSAIAHTIALVGQKRTGKTSTAVVLIEEAAAAGACFVVMDPTGAWAGLSSNGDGTGPGLDCVVMGGPAGDVPLAPGAGKVVAHLVIDDGYNVVCNLQGIARRDQITFVADFSEEALALGRRRAVTVVYDEAPRFVPQASGRLEADGPRCRMAVTELVSLGGRQGLGSIIIATRPSALHKDVLEEAEMLFAHRLMGNNDRKAVAGWVENAGDVSAGMLEALPKLRQGQTLALAPEYGVAGTFTIRRKRTFDSSDSPSVGAVLVSTPRRGRDLDLAALRDKMGAALRVAEENDPGVLRQRIAALERLIGDVGGRVDMEASRKARETATAEHRALIADLGRLLRLRETADGSAVRAAVAALSAERERLEAVLRATVEQLHLTLDAGTEALASSAAAPAPAPAAGPSRSPSPAGEDDPTLAQRQILAAIAALEVIGVTAPDKTQVAFFAHRSPRSSGYTNNLGALRSRGLVDYPRPGAVALTTTGRRHTDSPTPPATTEALHAFVRNLVGPARARILDHVIAAYPRVLGKEALASLAGVSPRSSGYTNNLGKLRSLGLIEYPSPGHVVAAPVLFVDRN